MEVEIKFKIPQEDVIEILSLALEPVIPDGYKIKSIFIGSEKLPMEVRLERMEDSGDE